MTAVYFIFSLALIAAFPHRWLAITFIVIYLAAFYAAAYAVPLGGTEQMRDAYALRMASHAFPTATALAITQFGMIHFRRTAIANQRRDEAARAAIAKSSPINTDSDPA